MKGKLKFALCFKKKWGIRMYAFAFTILAAMLLVSCPKKKNGSPYFLSFIDGPVNGKVNFTYTFSIHATDPENEEVAIRFDWGDGNISDWSSYVPSDSNVSMSHSWSSPGTYNIRAQAKDIHGNLSEWSAIHQIKIYSGECNAPGELKWAFQTEEPIWDSPAIGSDGTIYIGTSDKLYAINPDGSLKWSFTTGTAACRGSPSIGPDGTIYIGSEDGYLYAVNPDGSLKWQFNTNNIISMTPAIGSDGRIYIGAVSFFAINPDGTLFWEQPATTAAFSSPAIDSNGNIYYGSVDTGIYALSPLGDVKWIFPTGGSIYSSPAIGPDGTIYIGSNDKKLYAINPDGTLKWSFTTEGEIISSPAIGPDGTIYVGEQTKGKLYAINPDGSLKWVFTTGYTLTLLESSPAISSDGTIYVGIGSKLYAINPDGTLKWSFTTGDCVKSSPTIGSDGTIYVGSCDGMLYAICGSGTLANSPWPMFHHDVKHTGRVGGN